MEIQTLNEEVEKDIILYKRQQSIIYAEYIKSWNVPLTLLTFPLHN